MGGSELGVRGEGAARRHYEARGYQVLAQNWRCAIGELDLVLQRDGQLVICEVKTRSGLGFGAGVDAVHVRKQDKLRRLGECFVSSRHWRGAVRFDVASVAARGDRLQVEIFEDAF